MAGDGSAPIPQTRIGFSPNMMGAGWMLGSAVMFSAMATVVKYTGEAYSPALQTFYRQAVALVLMLPVMLRFGRAAFRTSRCGTLVLRATSGTLATMLMFYGFQEMPLVSANALSFTRALWLVLLAWLFLGERIGLLRTATTIVGFLGVLIMLGPEIANGFQVGLPALAMLGSSLFFAITVAGMKSMTRDTSPMVLMVWSSILGVLFALPGALLSWKWPGPVDLLLLGAAGALAMGSQACYIKGMQIGDATAMAPIDYFRLVFVALIGFVLFHEVPGLWTCCGAAVVIASTLYITLREHRVARRLAQMTAEAEAQT